MKKNKHYKPATGGENKTAGQRATEKFAEMMIDRMEHMKAGDWRKGWIGGESYGLPQSIYGRSYNGYNSFFLQMHTAMSSYKTPVYATFNKIKDMGACVLKDEKAFPVVYWEFSIRDKDGKYVKPSDYHNMTEEEKENCQRKPFLKAYYVFNIDQTNLEEVNKKKYDALVARFQPKEIKDAEGMYVNAALDRLFERQEWVCPIQVNKKEHDAYYSPSRDIIVVPMKEQFKIGRTPEEIYKDGMEYYSSVLHEMAHSTGTPQRLNRVKGDTFGDPKYAKEELVAELTAASVGYTMGFDRRILDNNAAYLDGWISVLKENPNFIISVMADVNKAADMVLEAIDKQRIALGQEPLQNKNREDSESPEEDLSVIESQASSLNTPLPTGQNQEAQNPHSPSSQESPLPTEEVRAETNSPAKTREGQATLNFNSPIAQESINSPTETIEGLGALNPNSPSIAEPIVQTDMNNSISPSANPNTPSETIEGHEALNHHFPIAPPSPLERAGERSLERAGERSLERDGERYLTTLSQLVLQTTKDRPTDIVFIKEPDNATGKPVYTAYGKDADRLAERVSSSAVAMRPEIDGKHYPYATVSGSNVDAVRADMMLSNVHPIIIDVNGNRITDDTLIYTNEDRKAFLDSLKPEAKQLQSIADTLQRLGNPESLKVPQSFDHPSARPLLSIPHRWGYQEVTLMEIKKSKNGSYKAGNNEEGYYPISKMDTNNLFEVERALRNAEKLTIPNLLKELASQVRTGKAEAGRDYAGGRYTVTINDPDGLYGAYLRGFKRFTFGPDLRDQLFLHSDWTNHVTAIHADPELIRQLTAYVESRLRYQKPDVGKQKEETVPPQKPEEHASATLRATTQHHSIDDFQLRLSGGRWRLTAKVDNRQMPSIVITTEDARNYKKGDLSEQQLITKTYGKLLERNAQNLSPTQSVHR